MTGKSKSQHIFPNKHKSRDSLKCAFDRYNRAKRGDVMVKKDKSKYPKPLTLKEATKKFLIESKVKMSKDKLKESTFSRYSFICERHIVPYFGNINLDSLNDEAINNFISYKLNNGGLTGEPLSHKTTNDIITLLLQIIKSHCKVDTDFDKPSYKLNEITIFTEMEYNKLKSYLSVGTDSKKLGIITAMLTGIRIGELCALKWGNIDLSSGVININKTIQRIRVTDSKEKSKTKVIIDTPKSDASIRKIPIPSVLLNRLKKFKSNEDSYLLTNTSDYIEPRVYQRHFKSYLMASDVKDNNFHTLRHTFATMAVANDMDIKTLSIFLGHSDVSFTMKRYVHPSIEHKRRQIEKLAVGF